MNPKTFVLIVEDDAPIANFLETALHTQEYRTMTTRTGEMGVSLALSWNPDVVLLDLGLPDLDGIEVIRRIRKVFSVPILILSARHQDHDKIEALDAGADDYLSKPFSVPELLARIRAVLRRVEKDPSGLAVEGAFDYKDLRIDFDARLVRVRESTVHLTPIEYDILCLLAQHHGRVLTHQFILERIRGQYQNASDSQALRVFVSNLRRKVERNPADPEYVLTEVGVGYRLNAE